MLQFILISSILAIIQALTEFLPVSSSGHLVLFQTFIFKNKISNSFTLDILLHIGTLFSSLFFLWPEIKKILKFDNFKESTLLDLALKVIASTLPAVLVVVFFKDIIESSFEGTQSLSYGFALTSIVIFITHKYFKPMVKEEIFVVPSYKFALLIGIAQALAIFPGASRSGMTICAALACGMSAYSSVKYSFFIFIPAALGALLLEVLKGNFTSFEYGIISTVPSIFIAFILGIFALRLLDKLAKNHNLLPFSIYTALLAILTFVNF